MVKDIAKYLMLFGLISCAEFKATPEAGIRRHATSRLRICLDEPPFRPFTDKPCLQESRKWCMEQTTQDRPQGMEPDCALDGMFGKVPGER